MKSLVAIIVAYLVGGIPFGFLISKHFYHVDIRLQGSGNVGATNVWRVLGRKPGIITLSLDILKGLLPVVFSRLIDPGAFGVHVLAGMMAIIGHSWSPFLNFKGGKGVATSAGVFLALVPTHTGLAIAGFLITFFIGRTVSLGSMVAAVILLISSFILRTNPLVHLVIIVVSIMVLIKHIPNMKRLREGTEPKVSFK